MHEIVVDALGVDAACPLKNAMPPPSSATTPPASGEEHSTDFDMSALLQWQYEFNEGHVYAFYHTVRDGPLLDQHQLWKDLGSLMRGGRQSQQQLSPLSGSHLLVFFGVDDDVVIGRETQEDILKVLPGEQVEFRYVPGGHGFVYGNSETILEAILDAWKLPHNPHVSASQ